jgi:hypothetical protein
MEKSNNGAVVPSMQVEVEAEMVMMGSKKAFSTSSILHLF